MQASETAAARSRRRRRLCCFLNADAPSPSLNTRSRIGVSAQQWAEAQDVASGAVPGIDQLAADIAQRVRERARESEK